MSPKGQELSRQGEELAWRREPGSLPPNTHAHTLVCTLSLPFPPFFLTYLSSQYYSTFPLSFPLSLPSLFFIIPRFMLYLSVPVLSSALPFSLLFIFFTSSLPPPDAYSPSSGVSLQWCLLPQPSLYPTKEPHAADYNTHKN